MRIPVLSVAAVVSGVLVVSTAVPATADGLYTEDDRGETAAHADITGLFVALNQEVISVITYTATADPAAMERADVLTELDTDLDGAPDYALHKPAGSTEGRLADAEGSTLAGCRVAVDIQTFSTGETATTVSTTAACLDRPSAMAAAVTVQHSSTERDRAPGSRWTAAVPRGYTVRGAVEQRWRELGGGDGRLGQPTSDEVFTARGGAYQFFQVGRVMWSERTGAHEVWGAVEAEWVRLGAEWGFLGYPLTGEIGTPGRYGVVTLFEGASVYWSPATGAHPLHGGIRQAWTDQGYETGPLGFPTSGERDRVGGGRVQQFEGGRIEWTSDGGAVVHPG